MVAGVPVIEEVFVPSPDPYDLNVWHTLAVDFSPSSLGGYLEGNPVLAGNDPGVSSIAVASFEIVFRQQDQPIDDMLITGEPYVVPVPVPLPGAALLGVLGLSVAGWGRRRKTA